MRTGETASRLGRGGEVGGGGRTTGWWWRHGHGGTLEDVPVCLGDALQLAQLTGLGLDLQTLLLSRTAATDLLLIRGAVA